MTSASSITNSAINAIVQNPDLNNWMKIIIPAFLSAILTGLIGYWFAKKRETIILKQKLEIDSVDELLRLIWTTVNDLNTLDTTYYALHFSQYNEQLKIINSILNKGPIATIDFHNSMLDQIKTNIDNDINELINHILKYEYSASEVIHSIESRKIILSGFKIFIDEILLKHIQQRDEMNLLTEKFYRFNLKNKINNKEYLSQADYDFLNKCFDNINKTKDILGCYYYDLEIALQNEIIGKLYKQKIKEREPLDPVYKVLRINKEIKW